LGISGKGGKIMTSEKLRRWRERNEKEKGGGETSGEQRGLTAGLHNGDDASNEKRAK